MINETKVMAQLVLHEGLKLNVYTDTEGNLTLGVGYNLSSRGPEFFERMIGRKLTLHDGSRCAAIVTREECLSVLNADILRVQAAVTVHWPYYVKLEEVRQRVAIDMSFNMGFSALGFKNTIAAAERRDWSRAVREMYRSKWARQVGDGEGGRFDRCDRLARMLLTGLEPTDIPSLASA